MKEIVIWEMFKRIPHNKPEKLSEKTNNFVILIKIWPQGRVRHKHVFTCSQHSDIRI